MFLKTLFRFPREIQDPDLGTLKFEHGVWCGQVAGSRVPVFFRFARRGPDAALRTTALQAVRELAEVERRARTYLAGVATDKPWPELKLTSIQVFRPVAEWVREEIAPHDPNAAEAILGGAPMVSLEFEIAGDRNVADVMLFNGAPVGWDYH